MLQDSNKTRQTRQYCVRLLRWCVFPGIQFSNKDERDIVYDSYVQNIDTLVEYAATNRINIEDYIKEIRTILLKTHKSREHKR